MSVFQNFKQSFRRPSVILNQFHLIYFVYVKLTAFTYSGQRSHFVFLFLHIKKPLKGIKFSSIKPFQEKKKKKM